METIFALASGAPPSAIAIVRISGPDAGDVLRILTGSLPKPRQAARARLRDEEGALLDDALILWFPGPKSATGEDCAELHLHGGRAVVEAVERRLTRIDGVRRAEPGEFTRRAFEHGKMNLVEVEALGQLVAAETEIQRKVALGALEGGVARRIDEWQRELLAISAAVEALLDHADEDDVAASDPQIERRLETLTGSIEEWRSRPAIERLAAGYVVVLAGPPNSGKSTLFNAITRSDAAIVTPVAGTTRDVLERRVVVDGATLTFIDTAGLRIAQDDQIERIGIERARSAMTRADRVLWLGTEGEGPEGALEVESKSDRAGVRRKSAAIVVSGLMGEGVDRLVALLIEEAKASVAQSLEGTINHRQRALLTVLARHLDNALNETDMLLCGEELRLAREAMDRLTGRSSTDHMLDALFGSMCIGK